MALTTAYAAGLRASEAVSLKVSAIDSGWMVIRVEQGKGGKDCYVMLSAQLLRILRSYWRLAPPRVWLFPGPDERKPIDVQVLHAAGLVLHTWGQTLQHHPHVHCLVPGGGPSTDWTRWIRVGSVHLSAGDVGGSRRFCSTAFLVGSAVPDVIEALERGNDLLVMGDDDDRGLVAGRHVIQDPDHRQRPFAVKRRCRLIGENDRRAAHQRPGDGDTLLFSPESCDGMALAR